MTGFTGVGVTGTIGVGVSEALAAYVVLVPILLVA